MNTPDIIAALAGCNYAQLTQIRQALDERSESLKAEFVAQAEAMGLSCQDENGKPKRKPRTTASKQAD